MELDPDPGLGTDTEVVDGVERADESLMRASQQFSGWDPSSIFGNAGESDDGCCGQLTADTEEDNEEREEEYEGRSIDLEDSLMSQRCSATGGKSREVNCDDSLMDINQPMHSGKDSEENLVDTVHTVTGGTRERGTVDVRSVDHQVAVETLTDLEDSLNPSNSNPEPNIDTVNGNDEPGNVDGLRALVAAELNYADLEDSLTTASKHHETNTGASHTVSDSGVDELCVDEHVAIEHPADLEDSLDTSYRELNAESDGDCLAVNLPIVLTRTNDTCDEEVTVSDSLQGAAKVEFVEAMPSNAVALLGWMSPERAGVIIQCHVRGLLGRKEYGKLQLAKEREKMKVKDIRHQESLRKMHMLRSVDMFEEEAEAKMLDELQVKSSRKGPPDSTDKNANDILQNEDLPDDILIVHINKTVSRRVASTERARLASIDQSKPEDPVDAEECKLLGDFDENQVLINRVSGTKMRSKSEPNVQGQPIKSSAETVPTKSASRNQSATSRLQSNGPPTAPQFKPPILSREVSDMNHMLTVVLEEVEGQFNDSLNAKTAKKTIPSSSSGSKRFNDYLDVGDDELLDENDNNFDILEDSLEDDNEMSDEYVDIRNRLSADISKAGHDSKDNRHLLSSREKQLLEKEARKLADGSEHMSNIGSFGGIPSRYAAKLMGSADSGHEKGFGVLEGEKPGRPAALVEDSAGTENFRKRTIPAPVLEFKGVRVGGAGSQIRSSAVPVTSALPSIHDLMELAPADNVRKTSANPEDALADPFKPQLQPRQPQQGRDPDSVGSNKRSYNISGNREEPLQMPHVAPVDIPKRRQKQPANSPVSINSARSNKQGGYLDNYNYNSDKESERASSRGRAVGRNNGSVSRDRSDSKGKAAPAAAGHNRQQKHVFSSRREERVYAATAIQRVFRGFLGRSLAMRRREQLSNIDRSVALNESCICIVMLIFFFPQI
jgi:hypothetical protein